MKPAVMKPSMMRHGQLNCRRVPQPHILSKSNQGPQTGHIVLAYSINMPKIGGHCSAGAPASQLLNHHRRCLPIFERKAALRSLPPNLRQAYQRQPGLKHQRKFCREGQSSHQK